MQSAKELIRTLRNTDEATCIEAKECSQKVDRSCMETICAFTNEPDLDGGYILVGVRADNSKVGAERYVVVGIEDPDKIQNEIVSNCSTMFNHRISPQIKVEEVEGKKVIVIKVSEGDKNSKPYFFEKTGLPLGAYRRIGATDQRCTEDDLPLFYSKGDDYDKGLVEDATLDDVDENALRQYRHLREKVNPHAEELTYSDSDLLQSLGCLKKDKNGEWRLTNVGLLVFGKSMALRRISPMVRVDYIRVSGNEWVEDPEKRFETIDMRGPMILLVNRIYNAIVDDLPRQFALNEGDIQSSTDIRIPERALREAIVNALIHRSYRVNRPLQIIRYSNRIEIINPGYSLKPEDSMGEPGSALRNPMISAIFHETDLAETKGSGMKIMRVYMSEAGLMPPTFESNHGNNIFTIRLLLHNLFSAEDMKWLKNFDSFDLTQEQKTAIVFLHEVGAIDLKTYRQLTGISISIAKTELSKLVNVGIIESKGRGIKSYYVTTELCNALFEKDTTSKAKVTTSDAKVTTSNAKVTTSNAKVTTSNAKVTTSGANLPTSDANLPTSDANLPTSDANLPTSDANLPTLFEQFPAEIREKVSNLKKRESMERLWLIVEELCSIHPLSIDDIAALINRSRNYVRIKIIRPLKQEGRLAFTHMEMINHPDQKYKVGFNSHFYKEQLCES